MSEMTVGILQYSMGEDREANVNKAVSFVEKAAQKGAQVILPPELFETHYFCREKDKKYFAWARPAQDNPTIARFQALAKSLHIALPVSFFERDGERYFNSIAFIDENGAVLGIYRKTFIPTGPGYEEKFYFSPGDTGFKVWSTAFGKIGVGICWDQWFPEPAREMTLLGADLLLYPTCIGTEPMPPHLDTQPLWQRAMIGHTVSNVIPLAAANRVGTEGGQTYYGTSFIASHRGDKIVEANRTEETVLTARLNFEEIRAARQDFNLLNDVSAHRAAK